MCWQLLLEHPYPASSWSVGTLDTVLLTQVSSVQTDQEAAGNACPCSTAKNCQQLPAQLPAYRLHTTLLVIDCVQARNRLPLFVTLVGLNAPLHLQVGCLKSLVVPLPNWTCYHSKPGQCVAMHCRVSTNPADNHLHTAWLECFKTG